MTKKRMIITIVLAVWFAMTIAVLAISQRPLRSVDTVRAIRGEGVARGMGWATLCFGWWVAIPQCEQVFLDFDTTLPAQTLWLVKTSHLASQYSYFLIPSFVFAIALGVSIFGALHRNEKSKLGAKTFSASITGALMLGILISMWAATLPLIGTF